MSPSLRAIGTLSVLFLLSCIPCHSQNTGYKARYTVPDKIFIGSTEVGARDGGTLVAGKWGQTTEDSSRLMVTKLDPYSRGQAQLPARDPLEQPGKHERIGRAKISHARISQRRE